MLLLACPGEEEPAPSQTVTPFVLAALSTSEKRVQYWCGFYSFLGRISSSPTTVVFWPSFVADLRFVSLLRCLPYRKCRCSQCLRLRDCGRYHLISCRCHHPVVCLPPPHWLSRYRRRILTRTLMNIQWIHTNATSGRQCKQEAGNQHRERLCDVIIYSGWKYVSRSSRSDFLISSI